MDFSQIGLEEALRRERAYYETPANQRHWLRIYAYNDELTPIGPGAPERLEQKRSRRDQESTSAIRYLLGEDEHLTPPPYGTAWDQSYNPLPYPEARPTDSDMYVGTGIGMLYGIEGAVNGKWTSSNKFWSELAGWTLVRTGSETRMRRKQ